MRLEEGELKSPVLIKTPSDLLLLSLILLTILSFTLTRHYQNYLQLIQFDWHTMKATVLNQVKRDDKPYTKLELLAEDFHFFTLSYYELQDLRGRSVDITIDTTQINFADYLKGFFAKSYLDGVYRQKRLRFEMIDTLHSQHSDPLIANLYGALFFVEPITYELRQKLTLLGINHLAALSGFHLGFLALLIMLTATLVYKPVHARYFPYRHRNRDIMAITLILLCGYLLFLQFPPSLLRAYAMMAVGFYLYDRGIRIVSFGNLFLTLLLLLVLFPTLFFSLGFWLSIAGVFMLFLILRHYGHLSKWQLFALINIAIFFLMQPLVFALFKMTSPGQLLSPFLSMIFGLFYPLTLLFHAIGIPQAGEPALMWLLSLRFDALEVVVGWWSILLYIFLSAAAIFFRTAFHALLLLAFAITVKALYI